MKIEKVLNNNVVVALDENGAETVLMGRGLGFGRREGDDKHIRILHNLRIFLCLHEGSLIRLYMVPLPQPV